MKTSSSWAEKMHALHTRLKSTHRLNIGYRNKITH